MLKKIASPLIISCLLFLTVSAQTFKIKGTQFLLNGKPFQIMSGEMSFQRIPYRYWKDRLHKIKAMGLNTVATYVFWNAVEPEPGKWNFNGNNNIRKFVEIAEDMGLLVLVSPGPYVSAEWSFGGLPPWLLSTPDIKVRCMNNTFMTAVKKYINHLADQIRDLQITEGGPIIMLQIENEYGSYGNDKSYLRNLKALWQQAGINIPFYTANGASRAMLEAGTLPGLIIGLDPAINEKQFDIAYKFEPNVPVFCSEYYSGGLTHWGEKWTTVGIPKILKDLHWLMNNKKSFNIYVVDGGTNFGWTAGANMGKTYEPAITSYDYDAPINEMGQPTQKYFAIRKLFEGYLPIGKNLAQLPPSLPVITIPVIKLNETASIFDNLPKPVSSVQPEPMEFYNQYHGFILYETKLIGPHSGNLQITYLHDYANIYIDEKYIGNIDRSKGQDSIELPKTKKPAKELEILVEAMGRINYGQYLIDRKGITDRVTLNGITLMNWNVYNLPMNSSFISNLKFHNKMKINKPGIFFKGTFNLKKLGDTYLDMSKWDKGIVWVNGHNLGRYWNIGPQQRLFLPATFLKKGKNKVIVFDLHKTKAATIEGVVSLK